MKKICLILFTVLCVVVFSCTDNLVSTDFVSQKNQTGKIKVFIKQSRLIGPETESIMWNVDLSKENDRYSGKNENGYYLFSGLSDGIYNINVSGKLNDVEKFTGSAVAKIENGSSVKVNVPIVAKKESSENVDATGYATITMDMSDKLIKLFNLLNSMGTQNYFCAKLGNSSESIELKANLVEMENNELNVSFKIYDNEEVRFFSESEELNYSIPTGYYDLTFSGLEDLCYSIKVKDNLVEIGDGLTTNIVLTQNDYELVQSIAGSDNNSIYYIDNSNTTSSTEFAVTTLSKPLGFRNIEDKPGATFYLITDVDTYNNEENYINEIKSVILASFGYNIFTVTNNYTDCLSITDSILKNIKFVSTTNVGFYLSNCVIEDTVILDSSVVKGESDFSCVCVDKSSNLILGQNFAGDLGIYLSLEDWKLGDTIVSFENGVKSQNCNLYICDNVNSNTNFSSKFYIDDNGKLAQYDDTLQWTVFTWDSDGSPSLTTQTQAQNKSHTTILYEGSDLSCYNGISTYDEENAIWYFIANNQNSEGVSLYSVKSPIGYANNVSATVINLDDSISLSNVKALSYADGKLYLSFYDNLNINFYWIDINSQNKILYSCSFAPTLENASIDDLTALLVDEDNVYVATTLIATDQSSESTIHSAIWQLKLDKTDNGYSLSPLEAYSSNPEYPVPYYLTQYDDELTIDNSFSSNSVFRITDLYFTDAGFIYGLLVNYEDKICSPTNEPLDSVYMRGSVFKLTENTSRINDFDPIMKANHFGLRDSFPLTTEGLQTAKKDFIVPRKIVGVVNKKLVIADDGMIPDENNPNSDRLVFFDLSGNITESINVGTTFFTNANTSVMFYTQKALFDFDE